MVTPFVQLMESITADPVAQIANTHTAFNIVTTLLLLPFGNKLAEIAVKMVRDWLDRNESDIHVIFNVFGQKDEDIYHELLFG